jgi:hypothetical protein
MSPAIPSTFSDFGFPIPGTGAAYTSVPPRYTTMRVVLLQSNSSRCL